MSTVIFETVHGSRAYGLAGPDSDVDRKGIVVGPREWYWGYRDAPGQIELSPDHTRFELRKFFRLAAAANPTLLEVLWTEPADHEIVTAAGERLLAARERFLSRRVKETFTGYALSQLRRIRRHRAWLLTPPAGPPDRVAFGLPERTLVSREQLGAAEALIASGAVAEAELTPNFVDLMDRERRYRGARKGWEQYQRWLRERNPARARLEAEFGYDTKHAQHLVRLLRMGIEVLATGVVLVRRPDADELRAIRAGAYSYDELIAQVERLAASAEEAAAESPLPDEPDEAELEELCVSLMAEVLAARG